jgi:hypothetical protein
VKNARPQESGTSAGTAQFYIDNPRERRLLTVLLHRGQTSRHDLDGLIGAENSPDVVMRMRRKFGLDLDMEKRKFTDRDGQQVRIGFYSLSAADRRKAIAALKCGV